MCAAFALAALVQPSVTLAATAPTLGVASTFAVLGATPNVTNTGSTIITGDVGVSPAASLVGFPPGSVIGTIHLADTVAANAQLANTAAFGSLSSQACDTSFAGATDLAGMTLAPGVYCFSTSAANTGLLTLDAGGDASAVWVFKIASTLITGSASSVVMANSGQSCNVFWQVGSSATLGTTTSFAGSILALTSITLQTGATLSGRALAQTGTVSLASNSVSVCSLAQGPTLVNPTLAKAFNPNVINPNGISTLTITLFNQNSTVATLTTALTDTLPAGVTVAPVPNSSTTCGGGTTVTAPANGSTVTLPAGRSVPANGSCTITVNVTATQVGSYVNTLAVGSLQTTNGNNPDPASATLLVQLAPTVFPPPAAAIPGLSDAALIVLTALMMLAALLLVRRGTR
jgi:type VI secretion system secreted protein VgrG